MESVKMGAISKIAVNEKEDMTNEISEAERRRLLRKIDVHLLPLVTILYILSFLDRVNIANARIAGMGRDAHLTGIRYNLIAAILFISYGLADIPSNIMMKLFKPSRWLPSIMIAWGLVLILMTLCKTFASLLIARFFLGLTESGLVPGVIFYLSMWYRKRDVAMRLAVFLSATALSGAFSGLLAYGIEHMEGIGGLHGWQWIFCLEGLATVVVAIPSYFMIHDDPQTATFLTPHEKQILLDMLREDTQGLATHYDPKFVWQALSDYKPYIFTLLHVCLTMPGVALSLFLPTIIKSLGFSAVNAQLLSMPPYIGAFAVSLSVAYFSDKYNLRGPFIIGGATVAIIGFVVLLTMTNPIVGYIGTIIVMAGQGNMSVINLAWITSSAGGDVRKGVTIAMVLTGTNLGAASSTFIYLKPSRFFVGEAISIALLSAVIILASFCMWNFRRLNKSKEAECSMRGFDESRKDEFTELGNESPLFRYTI